MNIKTFENMFTELILTGSRVFSSKKKDGDYDYFYMWSKELENRLLEEGFTGEDRSYCMGSKRFTLKNIDVFLFITEEFFDNYEAAHDLAIHLELRDLFDNKKDFVDVFIMMRGRYNNKKYGG